MPSPHQPTQNHLLATLPKADYARIAAQLELVAMPLGEAIYESGGKLNHVYFPTQLLYLCFMYYRTELRLKLQLSVMKVFLAYRCLWAVKPHPTAPWYKVRALVIV